MSISLKPDAPLDLVLDAAPDPDGGKIITTALNLLARHGVARKTAKEALLGALDGKTKALRVPKAADPKELLASLAAAGFPARRMKAPPSRKQIAAWSADDPDMAAGLKITGKPLAPSLVQSIRRALGLSQTEFAVRYGIPLHCIRAWEIRRAAPEAATLAYLEAIVEDPKGLAQAHASAEARKVKALEPAG